MAELFKKAIVQKRNVLNELRSNSMSLQELRFFSIYLSKINPRDVSSRVVRFPLDDFRRIMELGTDMNLTHFRLTIRHVLQQVVEVPNENGHGYKAFQLFKQAEITKDQNGEWYVEFDAHDKALPLMFEFKSKYFKYELWNALRLKSPNQVRMYEILKQYEKLGRRELTVTELRELLGIGKTEYADRTGWSNFKKKVLDSCQQALKDTTDICYTYERGKVGAGGKWLSIVFHIMKNTEYIDQLTLTEFVAQQPEPKPMNFDMVDNGQLSLFGAQDDEEPEEPTGWSSMADVVMDATKGEFSPAECEDIANHLVKVSPYVLPYNENRQLQIYDAARDIFLKFKREEEWKAKNGDKVFKRVSYMIGMIKKLGGDINE